MQRIYVIKEEPRTLCLKGLDVDKTLRFAIYTHTKKEPKEVFVFDEDYNITIDSKLDYGMYIYSIEEIKLDKIVDQIGFGLIEILPNIVKGESNGIRRNKKTV